MHRHFLFTIGHSTRPIDDFIRLLKSHGVQRVVDVRTLPRSRFNPHFDISRLPALLRAADIHYTHLPGLGGLRRPHRDSRNSGWRNKSFRGYADYMQSAAFDSSLQQCLELASVERVALMCAEAVPWRCHRSLIADALVARGIDALEIASEARVRPHKLTSFAHVEGTAVTYPAPSNETANESQPMRREHCSANSRGDADAPIERVDDFT
jgi:uncharacterized protein (DUF488 family)